MRNGDIENELEANEITVLALTTIETEKKVIWLPKLRLVINDI